MLLLSNCPIWSVFVRVVLLQINLESWSARINDFFQIRIHNTYSLFRSASEAGERRDVIEDAPKPRNGCEMLVLTAPLPPTHCYFWARICKRLRSPGIDSASLCSLAGRYDGTICRTGPPGIDSWTPLKVYKFFGLCRETKAHIFNNHAYAIISGLRYYNISQYCTKSRNNAAHKIFYFIFVLSTEK